MTPAEKINIDAYLTRIVSAHTPSISYDVWAKIGELEPHIHAWANGFEYELKLAGSLAKGTGITGTTDIDLFVSLHPTVTNSNTLENVYNTLRNRFSQAGYVPREQNVSVGLNHTGLKIDVVAGVKHHALGFDHSIWKRKAKAWTKTNVDHHVQHVLGSGRTFDIRMIKIWRKLRNLDFPSFYLELSVIEALKGKALVSNPSENFIDVMNYLASDFETKTIKDPANGANEVSEELIYAEKKLIKDAAVATLASQWTQAIW